MFSSWWSRSQRQMRVLTPPSLIRHPLPTAARLARMAIVAAVTHLETEELLTREALIVDDLHLLHQRTLATFTGSCKHKKDIL